MIKIVNEKIKKIQFRKLSLIITINIVKDIYPPLHILLRIMMNIIKGTYSSLHGSANRDTPLTCSHARVI